MFALLGKKRSSQRNSLTQMCKSHLLQQLLLFLQLPFWSASLKGMGKRERERERKKRERKKREKKGVDKGGLQLPFMSGFYYTEKIMNKVGKSKIYL